MSDTILQSNDVMDSRRGDIVVGVDGSDESFAALRWALGEASLTGQQVNAVYAWTIHGIWDPSRKMRSNGRRCVMISPVGCANGWPRPRKA